jgi:hypothetical protein
MSTPGPFDKADLLSRPRPLTKPVQVGGSLQSPWVVVPLLLAGLSIASGIVVALNGTPEALLVFLPLAAVLAVPGGVAALILLSRSRHIRVDPDGFTYIQGGKRETYKDEEIVGVSQRSVQKASLWRSVRIDVHTQAGLSSFDLEYEVTFNTPDPLYEFVDRIIRAHARRVMDGLEGGARLDGEGWHYSRDGLSIHHGPRRGIYPPDELTFFGFYGEALAVWRGDEVEPLLRVPDHTVNAHALSQIIWANMEKRPQRNDTLPGKPLGRLLSTLHGRDAWLGWPTLVFALGMAGLLVPMSFIPEMLLAVVILGTLATVLGGLALWLILRASYLRLAYHQFGIAQPGLGRSLLFTEMARMTWTNTFILLEAHDPDRPTIRFSSISLMQNRDEFAVRDHIAATIATRWWEELGKGPVQWTQRLRFLPEGLEYRSKGFLSDPEPVVAPYYTTSYYALPQWLEVFVTGAPAAVLQQPYNEPNFYPGLKLLDWIYEWLRKQYEEQRKAGQKEDHRVDFSKWRGPQTTEQRYRASDGPERQISPEKPQ